MLSQKAFAELSDSVSVKHSRENRKRGESPKMSVEFCTVR